jgi:hypothetical protein
MKHVILFSNNEVSDAGHARNLAAADKDNGIQVLDADVLDLVAGGTKKVDLSVGLSGNSNGGVTGTLTVTIHF